VCFVEGHIFMLSGIAGLEWKLVKSSSQRV
jgi:hypothetical protein